jgi:D-alanyl-D-alanine carboxypeptidase/D-alanyl-D-alanine-endopeptidase (penicillin-binding protein 4)
MNERSLRLSILVVSSTLLASLLGCHSTPKPAAPTLPANIKAIFDKPLYNGAIWGLRVVDLATGQPIIDTEPNRQFYIGSVRKVFTIGELINEIGLTHTYDTPVYRRGNVTSAGVLQGDLILVASGDLTMGGRTNPDGTIAYGNFDDNEANTLGNANLTKPDPLAGYAALAKQVAASGIKQITGNIIIDDRLFQPYRFRDQFNLLPIFVNDDVVDLSINPTHTGQLASMDYRPHSAALRVTNALRTAPANSTADIKVDPELPPCIGKPGCTSTLRGTLPANYTPPMTGHWPLIRTVRIVQPANYARTVFIEKLEAAGVQVRAPAVTLNPTQLLPAKNSYTPDTRVAELKGLPYSEDAKFILKVSYNIGADTSLILYGLTQGVDNMRAALVTENKNLQAHYGISNADHHFIDGSGGGDTTATNAAVTRMLTGMTTRPAFPQYEAGFPILGIDGSLATVTGFTSDPTLAPAKGQVHAKTGTYAIGDETGITVKGQAFAGYIDTRSGKKLVYHVVVNNVPIKNVPDILQIFQDEGTISAILWRDN